MVVRKLDFLAKLSFKEPGDIAGLTVFLLLGITENEGYEKSGCV